MINNRQGGRRRGRGGQRPQGMGGNAGGNRQDNRQRGNAAQLLEKYKNMARDAQLAGDRVQSEYYLQFADHYFRVLEESRSRFEEQNPQRRRRDEEDDDEGEEMIDAEGGDQDDAEEDDRPKRRRGRERTERTERPERPERAPRKARANGNARDSDDEDTQTIAMDALPPSIGAEPDSDEVDETEAKPRRRRLKPRAEDGDEASAA